MTFANKKPEIILSFGCDSKNIPAMCIDIQEARENITSRAHREVTGRLALEMGAPEQGAKRIL